MKTNLLSKSFIAVSMAAALAACSEDDTVTVAAQDPSTNTAPTHGGDISATYHEKDLPTAMFLLGTTTGAEVGVDNGDTADVNEALASVSGVVVDADGDQLVVTDLVATLNGETVEVSELSGFKYEPTLRRLVFDQDALIDSLDTGETDTLVLTYNISDGLETISRTLTVSVEGEDFAPTFEGEVVGNFTKDAGQDTSRLDLLVRTADEDGETLTVSDVVADPSNPYDLPFEVSGTELIVDVSSVAANVPDGETLTFNFSYNLNDHRFSIPRTIEVNVLGVNDVPGAPLIGSYFLEATINETDTVQMFNFKDDIVEREGDEIVISNLTLDGSEDMPFGVDFDGTNLTFDPHAFFHEVDAGSTKVMEFSFTVSDDLGNTSQGERKLTVSLVGEETNMVVSAGINPGFEDPAALGTTLSADNTLGFEWGYFTWWCSIVDVTADAARTGNAGLHFSGNFCQLNILNLVPSLEDDQKYVASYWMNNQAESSGPNSNPYVPLYASNTAEGQDNRFWAGTRATNTSVGTWFEHPQFVDTTAGGNWDGYENTALNFGLLRYDGPGNQYIDDFNMVKYGHFDKVAHDLIADDFGTFEAGETITADNGVAEIRDVDGANVLYVDTTGENAVSVSIPVKAGAIRSGHRYILSVDAKKADGTDAQYWVNLTNGAERIDAHGNGTTTGTEYVTSELLLTEEHGRTADVDWSAESMNVTLYLTANSGEYHIDNVRLIEIP